MARPTPAHALAEIEAVAKGLADLREAAGAADTEQDATSLKFAASELQHRLAALHLDKLGDDIDDPAWHDVAEALASLCALLDGSASSSTKRVSCPPSAGRPADASKTEPEAKALSNEDVARLVAARYGAGTRKPDLADYIVNGFEEGLRLTARAAWAGVKLAVTGAIAAGKLAAPVVVAAGEAAGRAGMRAAEAIARAWDESQHPRDENGKFTSKGAAMHAFAAETERSTRRLMKRAVRAWKRAGDGDLETLIAMMQALIEQTRAAREELSALAASDAELTPGDAALLDMLAALTVETRARADELASLAAASGAKSRARYARKSAAAEAGLVEVMRQWIDEAETELNYDAGAWDGFSADDLAAELNHARNVEAELADGLPKLRTLFEALAAEAVRLEAEAERIGEQRDNAEYAIGDADDALKIMAAAVAAIEATAPAAA